MASIDLHIETRPEGEIATVTVNRPEKINAISPDLIKDLTATFQGLADNDNLRAAILRGAGDKAMIGGADIKAMAQLNQETAVEMISNLHYGMAAVRDLPCPVIARAAGYSLGAGMEYAAACDMRIASDTAVFGMPEVKVGIPSVVEACLIPRLIGWGRASRMLIAGENIDAVTAEKWGFVEEMVPLAELDAAVERLVAEILNCGPKAVRDQKALMRHWERESIQSSIDRSITVFGEAFLTEEPSKLMGRFVNKGS